MLRFSGDIVGVSIMSLGSGKSVAKVSDVLIDPDNLTIAAVVCSPPSRGDSLLLLPQDIHDFSFSSITIQSEDDLMTDEDMVKLRDLIGINYSLIGKKVKTDLGRKLGVITEFVIDDKTFSIQKLHVRPSIVKLLKDSDLIVSRTQVVELNDNEVIVKDSTVKKRRLARAVADA